LDAQIEGQAMLQTAAPVRSPGDAVAVLLATDDAPDEAKVFQIGPFLVGSDGLLRPVSATISPRFSVRWRDRTVRAVIAPSDAAGARSGMMTLEAMTARVPSTASADGLALRERTFALLRQLPQQLPRGWRMHLLADHNVCIAADHPLPLPTSAADLLIGVTTFLLALDPYLAALDEAGLGFGGDASAGAGTANI
jgi:hypothetical protein